MAALLDQHDEKRAPRPATVLTVAGAGVLLVGLAAWAAGLVPGWAVAGAGVLLGLQLGAASVWSLGARVRGRASAGELLAEETSLRRVIQAAADEWVITFDTVDVPIMMLDLAGSVRRINRAAHTLAGRGFRECLGRRLGELGDDEPWTSAHRLVGEALATGRSQSTHVTDTDDGRSWDLRATLTAHIRDSEERMVVIMQDVTETVELEESMRRTEKLAAMGALVGGVAHEVRNPLFGLAANLDAMEATLADEERIQPYVNALRSQVDRLRIVMNELLEYGRSAGSEREAGTIHEAVQQAVADTRELARDADVELVPLLRANDPVMSLSRQNLITMFANVVANAVQHSSAGGRVVIETRDAERDGKPWVTCWVLDNGPGFSDQDLERVLYPFYTRRQGGLGLGMAMVDRIVSDHQGTVRIGNRPEGGAVVEVALPVNPQPQEI